MSAEKHAGDCRMSTDGGKAERHCSGAVERSMRRKDSIGLGEPGTGSDRSDDRRAMIK